MRSLLAGSRAWIVLAAALALVLLVSGWFLLVSPQFTSAAAIKGEEQTALDQAAMLQQKAASLRKQAEQLPQLQAELARLAAQLPDAGQEAELIKQLEAVSAASGMKVQSFSAAPLTPLVAAGDAAGAAEPAEASASGSASAAATPKPKAAALLSTQVQIELANGTSAQILDYLNKIEQTSRAFLLTDVSIAAASTTGESAAPAGSSYTLRVTGTIYARPAAPTPSATPATSGSTTATPSASPAAK